jgi:hypothetical protein
LVTIFGGLVQSTASSDEPELPFFHSIRFPTRLARTLEGQVSRRFEPTHIRTDR